MTSETIPPDLVRFINTSIPSVPYLEALLLLRSEPEKSWQAEQVANRLYQSDIVVKELLGGLCAAGLASEDDGAYRLAPQSVELSQMIDRLAQSYSRNLLEITRIIHSGTGKKAQIFADAFKWRKDP